MSRMPLERIEELFHQAADLDAEARAAFLDRECAGDRALRDAVEELLRHDEASDQTEAFIVSPIERAQLDEQPTASGQACATITLPQHAPPGYELIEVLGSGGMGVVIKARQLSLGRLVALKMLPYTAPVTPEQFARFRAEAQALASLQHPNIVQVYEVGELEGRPYLVMEYVPGPNLARELAGSPQPAREAAELVLVLAAAIQAVHDRGIIHRDLKPANVLLVSDESAARNADDADERSSTTHHSPLTTHQIKITDFGLAKRFGPDSSQTTSGAILGTPSYMAPEQARGRLDAPGPAIDIYALGAILYELLTGRPPFRGTSPEETITQLLNEDPVPPVRMRPSLPRDLVTICLKCLEKEPQRRYASAAMLAEDLRHFLAGEPIRARAVGMPERFWRWCRRRPLVATLAATSSLLAIALLVTILVYQSLLLRQTEHKLQGVQQQALQSGQLADEERRQLSSLDRALGARELEQGDALAALLWLTEALRLDSGDPEREREDRVRIAQALQQCPRLAQLLTGNQPVAGVQLSPSGCWLVMLGKDGSLEILEVLTGRVRPLRGALGAGGKPAAIALSRDGCLLAVVESDGATRVWNVDKGAPHTPAFRHEAAVLRATFGGDNLSLTAQLANGKMQTWDLRTGQPDLAAQAERRAARASAVTDNGRWFFALSEDGLGRVGQLPHGNTVAGLTHVDHAVTVAALRDDGRRLALVDSDKVLWTWDPQSGKETLLVPSLRSEGIVTEMKWSADGQRLLTVSSLNRARVWDAGTGVPLTPPLVHVGPLLSAGFAGSDQVLTVGRDGSVRIWELRQNSKEPGEPAPDNRPLPELVSLARVLSDRCLGADGSLLPLDAGQLDSAWKSLHP
ncbi:MAG TPA: serine/threonine-protein kinase [Gemmataceae bacterium]|nr:serine/threonine-protein kinase [Gemmataceae bacterium]